MAKPVLSHVKKFDPFQREDFPVLDLDVVEKLREISAQTDPDLLADLHKMFVVGFEANLVQLRFYIRKMDFLKIRDTAHSMKSTCSTLGLMRLCSLLAQIEKEAENKKQGMIPALAEHLGPEHAAALRALEKNFSTKG